MVVSGTLSSGKWHIILWEKKLIPSGNWTRGNWNTTVLSPNIDDKHGLPALKQYWTWFLWLGAHEPATLNNFLGTK